MKDTTDFPVFEPRSIDDEIIDLKQQPASYWQKRGEEMALALFEYARSHVPAYQRFLKAHKFSAPVQSMEDFKKIPTSSKKTYLREFEYEDLFPQNALYKATTISATSGSTGEPFYFPRTEEHDARYEYLAEIFLKNQFSIHTKKTLGIIGFGLGIWIGGIFTYKTLNQIAKKKGYNLTLIPVGANKDLYLKAFKKFAPLYDQVILMGYPPFIKDVFDTGKEYGINWKKHDIKILTAAEGYSEDFRNYIAKKAGIKNFYNDIINMYGTVEQGTLAHETAFANLIRNIASKDEKVFKTLFPKATNIPTLAQYYPQHMYFEEIDGVVTATGYGSSIPLVRYTFSDLGGVIGFDEIVQKLRDVGVDIFAEVKKLGLEESVLKLPFVYVYARSDFSVVFRGANIYPEEIRAALDVSELSPFITGKITIIRKEDKKLEQILEIHVELKRGVEWTSLLRRKILGLITKYLCAHNSEYQYLHSVEPEKVVPTLVGHSYQDVEYFSGAGKQLWVKLR